MHIPKPMSKHLSPTMSPPCCVGTQSSSSVSVSIFLYEQSESPNRLHIILRDRFGLWSHLSNTLLIKLSLFL